MKRIFPIAAALSLLAALPAAAETWQIASASQNKSVLFGVDMDSIRADGDRRTARVTMVWRDTKEKTAETEAYDYQVFDVRLDCRRNTFTLLSTDAFLTDGRRVGGYDEAGPEEDIEAGSNVVGVKEAICDGKPEQDGVWTGIDEFVRAARRDLRGDLSI